MSFSLIISLVQLKLLNYIMYMYIHTYITMEYIAKMVIFCVLVSKLIFILMKIVN